jgi:hypothetical protein
LYKKEFETSFLSSSFWLHVVVFLHALKEAALAIELGWNFMLGFLFVTWGLKWELAGPPKCCIALCVDVSPAFQQGESVSDLKGWMSLEQIYPSTDPSICGPLPMSTTSQIVCKIFPGHAKLIHPS